MTSAAAQVSSGSWAKAILVRSGNSRQWHVVDCPFCGGHHAHGGGRVGHGSARSFLGPREADCGGGGYELAEAAGVRQRDLEFVLGAKFEVLLDLHQRYLGRPWRTASRASKPELRDTVRRALVG